MLPQCLKLSGVFRAGLGSSKRETQSTLHDQCIFKDTNMNYHDFLSSTLSRAPTGGQNNRPTYSDFICEVKN